MRTSIKPFTLAQHTKLHWRVLFAICCSASALNSICIASFASQEREQKRERAKYSVSLLLNHPHWCYGIFQSVLRPGLTRKVKRDAKYRCLLCVAETFSVKARATWARSSAKSESLSVCDLLALAVQRDWRRIVQLCCVSSAIDIKCQFYY